jgi:GAF domain-containing protein
VQAVLDRILGFGVDITGATMGNVQLTDPAAKSLRIATHRGFEADFLKTFAVVQPTDGSACGRSMRERSTVVIEDVRQDAKFASYLDVAERAGFRAVQSTPLIASGGALVGVVSTHFAERHRPTETELRQVQRASELGANAIERIRVQDGHSCSSRFDANERPRAYLAIVLPLLDGRWRAEIPDFPGSQAEAATLDLALTIAAGAARQLARDLSDASRRANVPRSLQEIMEDPGWAGSDDLMKNAILSYVEIL